MSPTRVARGRLLTITGRYFGDGCYDTGTVPAGQGQLGDPLTGLVIVIDQGSNEFIVATGSADADYEFKVQVVVPAALEPGKAAVNVLGVGDARLEVTPSLVISTASPTDSADPAVATFGPEPPPDTEPQGTVPAPILPSDIPDENPVTIPPLSTAPIAQESSNTDRQRRIITVGFAVFVGVGAAGFALWSRANRRKW